MTTIAWDGRTLAADKQASNNGMLSTVTKIWRIGDVLCAGSGNPDLIGEMRHWVERHRQLDEFPTTQRDKDDWQPFMVVETDGSVSVYERTPYPIRPEDKFVTMGSGREFAMAALHLGCSARDAVELASKLDSGTGRGIDTLTLL